MPIHPPGRRQHSILTPGHRAHFNSIQTFDPVPQLNPIRPGNHTLVSNHIRALVGRLQLKDLLQRSHMTRASDRGRDNALHLGQQAHRTSHHSRLHRHLRHLHQDRRYQPIRPQLLWPHSSCRNSTSDSLHRQMTDDTRRTDLASPHRTERRALHRMARNRSSPRTPCRTSINSQHTQAMSLRRLHQGRDLHDLPQRTYRNRRRKMWLLSRRQSRLPGLPSQNLLLLLLQLLPVHLEKDRRPSMRWAWLRNRRTVIVWSCRSQLFSF